jgi:hypothetical protein
VQQKIACELTNIQENVQENDKYQKCSFGQSHTLQNQHKKPNKIKRRKSRISNPKLRSVFEVPEDLLNYRLM